MPPFVQPRFSIITPTLDRSDWLLRAVASVQAQTFTDYEHIIVNVGSDNVRPLLPRDKRIRYFHLPPAAGPAGDFQKALERVRGEIVHPFADDDELVPHALETVDRLIGDHAWAVAGTRIFNEHGNEYAFRGGSDDAVRQTAQGDYMLGGAIYWKRELTDTVGGFDSAYDGAADFELYRRFIRHSAPCVIGEALYLYNDHPGTDSRVHDARQAEASARIRREGQPA